MEIKKENPFFTDCKKYTNQEPKNKEDEYHLNKDIFDLDCKINQVVHRQESESQAATLPVSKCCWPSTIQCRTFVGCR